MSTQENKSQLDIKKELISGEDFENALVSAADVKNQQLSLCKSRNKNNYMQFYDLMLASTPDIQHLLETKKRNRSDDDNNKIKNFKKGVSQTYKQVCDLLVPEELEEGEESKIQKMVKKVTTVLKMLEYLGNMEIEKEFEKSGIKLSYKKLSEEDVFSQDHIKEQVVAIFENGKTIKEDINRNNDEIKTNIYENFVPPDLQYDKSMNPTGIKASDFCKLVDLKSKMMLVKDDEDKKEKLEDQLSDLASDYTFQNAKNEIIRTKLMEFESREG